MRLLILSLVLISLPVSARAANDSEGYTATYDVYAGGIHALQAQIKDAETRAKYDIEVTSKTYGILDKIVPWHARFSTQGHKVKGKRLPTQHTSDTTTRDKHEVNTFTYGKTGDFQAFTQTVDGVNETRTDIDPSIYRGTTDILTAIFSLTDGLGNGEACPRDFMLFDSERSYRLIFRNGAKKTLKASKYSSFEGEAIGCEFEIQPEGGTWHKKPRGWLKIQEQAKKSGQPPVIYFANVSKTGKPLVVPVRTVIKTSLGTFIAHMTSFADNAAK